MSPKQYFSQDRFWDALVDAENPSKAEMAAEERQLRTLEARDAASAHPRGQVEALRSEVIDELVANAAGSSLPRALEQLERSEPRGAWRKLMLSALLAVSVVSVAWVIREMVWTQQQDAPLTLDYVMAVELATEPNRNDRAYLSALGVIAEQCGFAAETLQQLGQNGAEPLLATQARQVAAELIALGTSGPASQPGAVDLRLVESASIALNPSLRLDERQAALTHIRDLVTSGLTAMLLSPLSDSEAKVRREHWIAKLLETLSQ